MARRNLKPVSLAGIEFDALIDETKTLQSTIPAYPVEDGFPVSDTIILDPITVTMTLYVSNTPVTWLFRHGSSVSRVNDICDQIENLWLSKSLVKIVTTDAIYTNMGLTSISIKKSKEIGYAREITLTAQKVRVTSRKTTGIPDYVMKSGETEASAGTASTSTSSANAEGSSEANTAAGSVGTSGGGNSTSGSGSEAEKSASILYGAANGLGFI